MLKVIRNRETPRTGLSAQITTLSVSWLNREFKAIAIYRGIVEGEWESPEPVQSPAQLGALIREAVRQTGYRGSTVTLLLAHPRLVQQVVDLPPVSGPMRRKLLQRQAQQQRIFPGDAAWAYQPTASSKTEQRVVLHLLPRVLLNQCMQACQAGALHLAAVVPVSAVLQRQIQQLPLNKGEIGVVVAETGGSTTIVVGHADGRVILARTLPGTWNDGAERVALDINRTLLFVNQQHGLVPGRGIYLFGPGAAGQVQALRRVMQVPVELSPVPEATFYWPLEVLRLRPAHMPNFVSPDLANAPQRQVFAKVVAAAAIFAILASSAIFVYSHFQARQEEINIKFLTARLEKLQIEHQTLTRRNNQLASRQEMARLVVDDRVPPVPVWFLGYLSEAVPSDLVVTNLQVVRHDHAWKMKLSGVLQPLPREPRATTLADAVAQLKLNLADGPFHVRLASEQKDEPVSKLPTPVPGVGPAWLVDLTGKRPEPQPMPELFALEGVMQ